MKESVFKLITELCSSLGDDLLDDKSDKMKHVKHWRSIAFEVLLTKRNLLNCDIEDDPSMLLVDISGHVYWSAKERGEWTKEVDENVKNVMDRMEILVKIDPSLVPVLKLLLCLAESSSPANHLQEPSYGLDMRSLISKDLKRRPLMKQCVPAFNCQMFEFPESLKLAKNDFPNTETFCAIPGTGLKHQEFFTVPTLDIFSSGINLTDIDNYDLTNANWIFPTLQNINSEISRAGSVSRTAIHQDEGYVTPDQDQKLLRGNPLYIPWERMYEEDFKAVYSWETLGSSVRRKELPFISQNREAMGHIWKVVHASLAIGALNSGSDTVPIGHKLLTPEELETAISYLLIGVESNIFHFSQAKDSFVVQGLYLNGLAAKTLEEYCKDYIDCGNSFRCLSSIVQKARESATLHRYGLIYQVLCSSVCQYLQCYRGVVLQTPLLHTQGLLCTHSWLQGLQSHLCFLLSVCGGRGGSLPRGSALLVLLYNQVPLVTQTDLSYILYYILQSCCNVYFEFLKKWIFEGLCDDPYKDFFIEACPMSEIPHNRKFWNRSFVLNRMLVPGFLRELEDDILVCGKTVALLKLCAPNEPVCLVAKQERCPGVECCLNRAHLEIVEARCRGYQDRCRELSLLLHSPTPAQPQDPDLFAALRAKSLDRIKQVQEEEKILRSKKKHLEFDLLKKSMEEAVARKAEDKKIEQEEEEKILGEAEKMEQMNKLRREEERQRLLKHYSALSESADRRRERAEWKIKRAQLHEKRVTFLKENEDFKPDEAESTNHLKEESKISYEKKEDSSLVPVTSDQLPHSSGSGDREELVTGRHEKIAGEIRDSSDHLGQQTLELTARIDQSNTNTNTNIESESRTKDRESKKTNVSDDEKRDWILALDVAEKARQCAMKFKERNMFNDYNIITGEVTTYQSRFGENLLFENDEVPVVIEGAIVNPEECQEKINVIKTAEKQIDTIQKTVTGPFKTSSSEVIKSESPKPSLSKDTESETSKSEPLKTSTSKGFESVLTKPSLSEDTQSEPPNTLSGLQNDSEKKGLPTASKADLKVDEIDMTTIYQNLRMSVMIPLMTQLNLANEAVLRLFFEKHNLLKHLECIRRYFFLLDGEYGRNLTRSLFSEIQTAEHPAYILSVSRLNSLLRLAVGTCQDEEYTERLSFVVKEVPQVFKLTDPQTLDCLSMSYKRHWPLNIIITDEGILKYTKIFTFLMQLQRTSWALEQDIYLLKDKRLMDSLQYRQVQLYRHIMTHFVSALKNYVTTVVLEDSWFKFQEQLKKGKTLNDIYNAHVKYIKMLQFRCLLNKRSRDANTHLLTLFGRILLYHEILRGGQWIQDAQSGDFRHSGFSILTHEFKNFLKQAQYIHGYLECLACSGYQPYLEQLLTLLSTNDFYHVQ